ncbi:MAG: ATP-binding cassette domain-containing protein [Oscillospiraceae bacterium]|nr:ATP-binding cassette domain-containing protein [Oscillospiraceae bacterium]
MEIISIKNLNFKYPNSKNKAVDNVNLSFNQGEFIVVCGESGSGKTTLMKLMKREIAPFGEKSGEITYKGQPLNDLDKRTCSEKIGFVFQKPEQQIVTDKVWHELAFGLESLGYSTDYIRLRVGEMSSYFGISHLFHKKTTSLSGGEKQLMNLASVMAMSPDVLILDEPTSQLDPIAANDFITTLYKLNRELGITVIISEHRLQELFPIGDKVMVLEQGRVIAFDSPREVCGKLINHKISLSFPSAVQIWNRYNGSNKRKTKCPLTVKEGRDLINSNFSERKLELKKKENKTEEIAVELEDVFFRYTRSGDDVLKGTTLRVQKGEHFCILGGNGSGKTTTLKIIAGIISPYRGKVFINGKNMKKKSSDDFSSLGVAFLPQNPDTLFLTDSIRDDYLEMCKIKGYSSESAAEIIEKIADELGIAHLMNKHPYDLSGGEIQRCAVGKILLANPKIILLDEPTKGMDSCSKNTLAKILDRINSKGVTIVTVTHDVEFAAVVAHRCGLFFDGEILSSSIPQKFFSMNNFYTTSTVRICRDKFKNAVTVDDAVELMEGSNE